MIQRNVANQVITMGPLLYTGNATAVVSGANLTISVAGVGNSAGAGTLAHWRSGVWQYTPTQGESNTTIIGLSLEATGATPVALTVLTTYLPVQTLNVLPAVANSTTGGLLTVGTANGTINAVNGNVSILQAFPTNFGNLAITTGGNVTLAASQNFNNTGNWTGTHIGNTTGSMSGNVGGVTGNVGGSINGAVLGGVQGGVTGDLDGNLNGSVQNVLGDVLGSVAGNIQGNINGNVQGDVLGNVNGNLYGDVYGEIEGNVTGNVTGLVLGNVSNVLALANGTIGNSTFANGTRIPAVDNVTGNVTLGANAIGNATFAAGTAIPATTLAVTTGNVSGSVLGNVAGSVLGNVAGSVLGNLSGSVGNLSTTAVTAIWNFVLTGAYTAANLTRGIAAAAFGNVTAAGTANETFFMPGGTAAAIVTHGDGEGNRTPTLTL